MTPEEEDQHYEEAVKLGGELAPYDFKASFELFLQGYSLVKITETYPHINLSLLVRACRDFDWEERRTEGRLKMMDEIAVKALSLQSNALDLANAQVQATLAKYQANLNNFVQDPSAANFDKVSNLIPKDLFEIKTVLESAAKLVGSNKAPAPAIQPPAPTEEEASPKKRKAKKAIAAAEAAELDGDAQKKMMARLFPTKE